MTGRESADSRAAPVQWVGVVLRRADRCSPWQRCRSDCPVGGAQPRKTSIYRQGIDSSEIIDTEPEAAASANEVVPRPAWVSRPDVGELSRRPAPRRVVAASMSALRH